MRRRGPSTIPAALLQRFRDYTLPGGRFILNPVWPSLDSCLPADVASSYPGADRAYTPGTYDIQLVAR